MAITINGSEYATIQEAINAAQPGEIILVGPGTYTENLVIPADKDGISLLSTDGAGSTTIVGTAGSLGTILLQPGADNVRIGDLGQGFTVVGFDGDPGLETAAVYLQGAHAGVVIQGNDIVANGDAGLMSEYAFPIIDLLVDSNVFSGQTFVGDQPAGSGFGQQFTLPNVPRQLVVLGNGSGSGPSLSSGIVFSNNEISGVAGGESSTNPGVMQGNTLVTIDATGSQIFGNIFSGFTAGSGYALRARRGDTDIHDNTVDESGGGGSLNGGAGADRMYGEAGDDVITGGADRDLFYFGPNAGNDTITDFVDGLEKLYIQNVSGVDDFSDLSISTNGSGWAVITYADGSSITLVGVTAAQVGADDFIISGG